MKKEMRLAKQKLDHSHAIKILEEATFGILSTISEDGMPYGVPMNFAFADDKLYFHSALAGHKLENIRFSDKTCFTVVGKTKVLPELFTSQFESVIAFGTTHILEEPTEIAHATRLLCEKYTPNRLEIADKTIAANMPRLAAFVMTIDYFTGKTSKA